MIIFELTNTDLIILQFILAIIKLKHVDINARTVNGRLMTLPHNKRIVTYERVKIFIPHPHGSKHVLRF